MFWLGLTIGVIVGFLGGVFVISLCTIGAISERDVMICTLHGRLDAALGALDAK